jgi:prepilin-type N-terminal cleavage/methylation domain-containing protein
MKKAFTLAEVLITLCIIGVVAALTIPGLIADYQEKSRATARTVFISRMEEATRVMNVHEKLAGYSTTEAFVDELVQNLKTIKVCKTNPHECFSSEISNDQKTIQTNTLKTAQNFSKDFSTNIVGLILANGYSALLAYDPGCKPTDVTATGAETTSCLSMVYDVNGKSKPNRIGNDVYTLNAEFGLCIKIGSLCVASTKTAYSPVNTCDGTSEWDKNCTTTTGGSACTSVCTTNQWAGAKKACAEQGMRLPTWSELSQLYDNKAVLGMADGYYFSSEDYNGQMFRGAEFWTSMYSSDNNKTAPFIAWCVK